MSRPCAAQVCTASATAASFANYVPVSTAPTTTTASVVIACHATVQVLVTYTAILSAGSGTFAARTLRTGSHWLYYQLYTDPAHTQIWGDGTGGTSTVQYSYLLTALASTSNSFTAYGQIPAQQNVSPGSYQDTLMVTVTY